MGTNEQVKGPLHDIVLTNGTGVIGPDKNVSPFETAPERFHRRPDLRKGSTVAAAGKGFPVGPMGPTVKPFPHGADGGTFLPNPRKGSHVGLARAAKKGFTVAPAPEKVPPSLPCQ